MKMKYLIILIAVLFVPGIFIVSFSEAEEESETVMTILEEERALFEPARPSIRKVVMTLRNQEGEKTAQIIMGQAFKGSPEGKKMLLVMLEPSDVKGLGYLRLVSPDGVDMFTYIPSLRRTKRISGLMNQHASFFTTDYTYADLGFIELKGDNRILGQEEYEGVTAYKVEKKISDPMAYYSRTVTWIGKDSVLPLKREFYAPSGDLYKVERFKDIKIVDGVPTAMRRIMKDVMAGTSTELDMQELQYCSTLSDDLFDPDNLSNVAADPIWQPYCTMPEAKE